MCRVGRKTLLYSTRAGSGEGRKLPSMVWGRAQPKNSLGAYIKRRRMPVVEQKFVLKK